MMAEPTRTLRPIPGGARPREDDIRLALAAAGDPDAEHEVTSLLLGKVRQIVTYAVNDPVWSEDLTQIAMLKILSSLCDYHGESSLSFWSTKIAVRIALKAMRTQRRRQLLFFIPKPKTPFWGTYTSNNELRIHINQLVAKLPVKQQVVIRLRYVHEHSVREISEILEVPEDTVRDRLRVGKKRLKSLIDKAPKVKGRIYQGCDG